MKLRFDHSYTADQNFRFMKKLGKSGFLLRDYKVEHPGKRLCKFIMFPRIGTARMQYLEFIHCGKGGKKVLKPGLSFTCQQPVEPFANKLRSSKLTAAFEHRNYDWKSNSSDRLPGWNFVRFPKVKSKIYTWLTEYEFIKYTGKFNKPPVDHPNQVYKFVAIEAVFNKEDVYLYTKLCGKPRHGEFRLSCGTPLRFQKGEKSRINSYVLATKDLKRFVKKFPWDELTTYQGKPALRIANPDRKMWDVLIIEE